MNKAAFRSSRPELFPQKALERRSKSRGEHVCGSVMATKLLRNFIEITLPHGLSLSLSLSNLLHATVFSYLKLIC